MSAVHTAHGTYYLDVTLGSQNQAGNYSTINIGFYAIADSGWGVGSTASGIGFSVNTAGNGTFSLNGTSFTIYSGSYNVAHDAAGNAGTFTVSAHSNDTTTSTYGGPVDLSQGIALPRIPKPPSAPASITPTVTSHAVSVNFTGPADNGGSAVTTYTTQYSFNGGAFTGTVAGASSPHSYTGLAAGSYVFRVSATNAIGTSAHTTAAAVVVKSGGKRYTGSAFINTATAKRWTGSAWIDLTTAKRWTGSSWVDLS